MKTFYLSFADDEGFRGACVIDVTTAQATEMLTALAARFPNAKPGAEWVAAASQKAWQQGCNPGGQVLSFDITGMPMADRYPRNILLSKADLELIAPIMSTGDLP